jgi:dihydrofolate reductase
MRRIFSFHVVTVDGYDEGPNQEFDWPNVDKEFDDFAVTQIDEADTMMFGRKTYEVMAAYWPTPEALESDDRRVAELMNGRPKYVVSTTLEKADWGGTQVLPDLDALRAVKAGAGGDIVIMGSSALVANLLAAGLIDEVRVMVNPIVLGAGRSLFHTADRRYPLKLIGTRVFDSGNVLLRYQP